MPEHVEAFVSMGLWGDLRGVGECQAVGFADEGGLVAGVLFHNWQPDNGVIEMTAYSSAGNVLTRGRLRQIFHYPFEIAGCRIVLLRTAETNTRVRRMALSVGASEHLIPELFAPGVAECFSVIKRDDWLKSKYARSGQ